MNFFLAVTDNNWLRHLSTLADPDEVNFWQPRGPRPKALQPGDLFLFKLHWPDNYVVGGDTYTYAPPTGLPVSLAWEAFGPKNGAPSFEQMLARIATCRDAGRPGRAEYDIGCIHPHRSVLLRARRVDPGARGGRPRTPLLTSIPDFDKARPA